MQVAYARQMEREASPRQKRRRERLAVFFKTRAKASELEQVIGTPATYFSAILAGKRGLGDAVAAKIERAYSLGEGWFDSDDEARLWLFSAPLHDAVKVLDTDALFRLENVIRATLGMDLLDKTLTDEERLALFAAIHQPPVPEDKAARHLPLPPEFIIKPKAAKFVAKKKSA